MADNPSGEMILVEDIPAALQQEMAERLLLYTVAFLRVGDVPEKDQLLGSGTLISTGRGGAILTAQHVLKILPRDERLCLLLGPTTTPHTLDILGLTFIDIAKGKDEESGPDLGAILLAPSIAGAIASKKPFYDLAARRTMMLESPPALDDGIWIAHGFIDERTQPINDAAGIRAGTAFYNFSGVGGAMRATEVGEHDYLDCPVSFEARTDSPQNYGGMSGGGFWQIKIKRDADGRLSFLPPLLSGVVYYQFPTTPTTGGVKAHGRRSVYRVALDAIDSGHVHG